MNASDTATTHGARDHARAQAAAATERFSRSVPAGDPGVLWCETVEAGNYATRVLPRGARLMLRDPEGDTSVQLLVFNHHQRAERLNVPDTVKVQWQAYLGQGRLLLSDMGRVLMSFEADSSAGHDTFNAMSNRAWNDAKYGSGAVHSLAPNARDRFAVALGQGGARPPRHRPVGQPVQAGVRRTGRIVHLAWRVRHHPERKWCCAPRWTCSWH